LAAIADVGGEIGTKASVNSCMNVTSRKEPVTLGQNDQPEKYGSQ
jgi:hypothetical protein